MINVKIRWLQMTNMTAVLFHFKYCRIFCLLWWLCRWTAKLCRKLSLFQWYFQIEAPSYPWKLLHSVSAKFSQMVKQRNSNNASAVWMFVGVANSCVSVMLILQFRWEEWMSAVVLDLIFCYSNLKHFEFHRQKDKKTKFFLVWYLHFHDTTAFSEVDYNRSRIRNIAPKTGMWNDMK